MPARRKIIILGARGRLGAALVRRCSVEHDVMPLARADLDLLKPAEIESKLAGRVFDALINAAGITSVDRCETHPDEAVVSNATAPEAIARVCRARGAKMIHVSTDYVFSGEGRVPQTEDEPARPANVYGATKLEGERLVMQACPDALVARISWLFGLDKDSFPDRMIKTAMAREHVDAVCDKWSSPTYAEDLSNWMLHLLSDHPDLAGVLHLCNAGWTSWHKYGQTALDIAARLGVPLRAKTVAPISMHGFAEFKATRPPFTVLDTTRFTQISGIQPRPWQDALEEYVAAKYVR